MFDMPEWTGAPAAAPSGEPPQLFAGVRFQRAGKVYHYSAEGFPEVKVGNWVIVDTARGRQMAQVATTNPPKDKNAGYKRIDRLATGRDMAMRHYYENRELEAMIACRAENADLKLPIKIVRAEYSFDGQTLTFLYSSDEEERVEVAELRNVMGRLYRARVEFRQISPREVAKIIGGLGACGIEERCCSRFLTDFSPISIKHAKEQNLSLNPNDITGMCGRLRCCLIFEFEQYVEARRHLPKLKAMIGTPIGEAKVIEVLPMQDSVVVKIGEAETTRIEQFHREQLVPLEEYRKLQEKAASGTCDKHEGGNCDCGKKKADGAAPSGEQPRPEEQRSRGAESSRQMERRQQDRERERPSRGGQRRDEPRRDSRDQRPSRDSRDSRDQGRPQRPPPPPRRNEPRGESRNERPPAGDGDSRPNDAPSAQNTNRPPRKPLLRRK